MVFIQEDAEGDEYGENMKGNRICKGFRVHFTKTNVFLGEIFLVFVYDIR